jgi:hypothetical protein
MAMTETGKNRGYAGAPGHHLYLRESGDRLAPWLVDTERTTHRPDRHRSRLVIGSIVTLQFSKARTEARQKKKPAAHDRACKTNWALVSGFLDIDFFPSSLLAFHAAVSETFRGR